MEEDLMFGLDDFSLVLLLLFLLAFLLWQWGSGWLIFGVKDKFFGCGRKRFIIRVSEESAELIRKEETNPDKYGND